MSVPVELLYGSAAYAGGKVGAQGGAAKSSEGFREIFENEKGSYFASDAAARTAREAEIHLTDREKEMLRLKSMILQIEAALQNAEEGTSDLSVEEIKELRAKLQELKQQLYAMQFNLV